MAVGEGNEIFSSSSSLSSQPPSLPPPSYEVSSLSSPPSLPVSSCISGSMVPSIGPWSEVSDNDCGFVPPAPPSHAASSILHRPGSQPASQPPRAGPHASFSRQTIPPRNPQQSRRPASAPNPPSSSNPFASLSSVDPELPSIFMSLKDNSKKRLAARRRMTSSIRSFGPPDLILTIRRDSKAPWVSPKLPAQEFVQKFLPSISKFIDPSKSGWNTSSSLLLYLLPNSSLLDVASLVNSDMKMLPSEIAPLGSVLHVMRRDAEVRVRFTCSAGASPEDIIAVLFDDLGLDRSLLVGPILRAPSSSRSDQHVLISFWSACPPILAAYAMSDEWSIDSAVLKLRWSFVKLPGFMQHSCNVCMTPHSRNCMCPVTLAKDPPPSENNVFPSFLMVDSGLTCQPVDPRSSQPGPRFSSPIVTPPARPSSSPLPLSPHVCHAPPSPWSSGTPPLLPLAHNQESLLSLPPSPPVTLVGDQSSISHEDSDPEVIMMSPTNTGTNSPPNTPPIPPRPTLRELQKSLPIPRKTSSSSLSVFLGVPLLSEREIILQSKKKKDRKEREANGKSKENEKEKEKKKKKRQTPISFEVNPSISNLFLHSTETPPSAPFSLSAAPTLPHPPDDQAQ